jgi:short-subunit dehydrogenase
MNATVRPLALVTGASSGIGYELARELAEHGYDLIIAADDQGGLEEAARTLGGLAGAPQVQAVHADLSTAQGVEKLYDTVRRAGRPLDVLAANAGIGISGSLHETDLATNLKLINLNVTSQVHLTKLAVDEMVPRGAGRILITSSIAALMPGPYYATYAASKSFLRSFGHALRYELKDSGVTVTVLMPGPTDTEFFDRAGMEDTKVAEGSKQDPAEVAKAAYAALERGDDQVITGAKNKMQAAMSKVMPEQTKAKVHAAQTEKRH